MKLTAENVPTVMKGCMFTREKAPQGAEAPEGAVVVRGIIYKFGFHPERLEASRESVAAMLEDLEPIFRHDIGGGYTFMSMVVTREGVQWGEQRNAEQLLVLGLALGYLRYCAPREMWPALPGGVPYVVYNPNGFEDLAEVAMRSAPGAEA